MTSPTLKLILATAYSFLVAFTQLEYFYILAVLLLLYFEKEFFTQIIKKIFLLNFFILFLVLFVAFEDKNKAIELFFRTNLILSFNVAIFYKSKAYDIIRALDKLKFSPKIITISYFTITLIDYLTKEFREVKATLKARDFKTNISLFTYKTFGNIFALMFIKSIRKSQEINNSMQTRNFNGKIYLLNKESLSKKDIVLTLLIITFIVIKGIN